jgi:hypothetical protein
MPLYALSIVHTSAGPVPTRTYLGGLADLPTVHVDPARSRKYSTLGDIECAIARPSPRLAEWLRLRNYRVEVVKICDANQYEAPVPGEAVLCTASATAIDPTADGHPAR